MIADVQSSIKHTDSELAKQLLRTALEREQGEELVPTICDLLAKALVAKLYEVAEVCVEALGDEINCHSPRTVVEIVTMKGCGAEAIDWLVHRGAKISDAPFDSIVKTALEYDNPAVLRYALGRGLDFSTYDLLPRMNTNWSPTDNLCILPIEWRHWGYPGERIEKRLAEILEVYDILYEKGLRPTAATMAFALFQTIRQPEDELVFMGVVKWLLAHGVSPNARIDNPYNDFRGNTCEVAAILAKIPGAVRDDPLIACMAEWRWARIWHRLDPYSTLKWYMPRGRAQAGFYRSLQVTPVEQEFEMFVEAGVDLNAPVNYGITLCYDGAVTVLDMAMFKGDGMLAEFLRAHGAQPGDDAERERRNALIVKAYNQVNGY